MTQPWFPGLSTDALAVDLADSPALSGGGIAGVFRPETYGAVRDGVTNDAPAIQAAVNAAAAAGGGRVVLSIGTYFVSTQIDVTASNIVIIGQGRGLTKIRHNITDALSAFLAVFRFTGTVPAFASPTLALTANAKVMQPGTSFAQAQVLTVASSTGIAAGDIVLVGDNNTEYTWTTNSGWGNRYRGEMARVQATTGTTVTLETPTRSAYATANSAGIWKPALLSNVGLHDLTIYSDHASSTFAGGATFDLCADVNISGLHIRDLGSHGMKIRRAYGTHVDDVIIEDLADDSANGRFGYGIILEGTESTVISDSTFRKNRHGVSTGGITSHVGWTRNTLVTGCVATECSNTGFDTHAWTTDFTFSGCRAERNVNGGFSLRSERSSILNCATFGNSSAAVYVMQQQAKQNVIRSLVSTNDLYGVQVVSDADGTPDNLTIADCSFIDTRFNGIWFNSKATNARVQRNNFVNVGASGMAVDVRNAVAIGSGGGMTGLLFEDNVGVGVNSLMIVPSSTETGFIVAGNRLLSTVGTLPAPVKLAGGATLATDPYAVVSRPSGGTEGQVLALDASGNVVWVAAGSGVDATSLQLVDDFISGSATVGTSIGALGWNRGAITSGNGTSAGLVGELNHPGILQLSSGTVAGGLLSLHLTPVPTALADNFHSVTWYVRPTQIDADTRIRIGFVGNSGGDPSAHGAYFERLYGDTNWFAVTRNGTTETRTDTGTAAAAATWVKLRVRRVSGTSYGFAINGGTELVVTATLPGAGSAWNPAAQIGSQTTTAKTLDVDRFEGVITGISR